MDLNAQNQDSGTGTAKPGDLQGTAASIEDKAEDLLARESAMLGSATEYVRANPRRAVGIAFVAGFLVGRILL